MIPLKDNIPTARFPVVTVAFIAINLLVYVWQLSLPGDKATSSELATLEISERAQFEVEYGAIPYRVAHPSQDCSAGRFSQDGQRVTGVVCEGTADYREAEALAKANPQANPLAPLSEAPWVLTLLTSMFMHSTAGLAGLLHIGGNMLFLWVFGNNIEDSMGRLKFVVFYLLAGLAAVGLQSAIDLDSTIPMIGASGAVAGVLGAYALLHPAGRVLTLVFIVFFVTLIEVPAAILLGIWFLLQFIGPLQEAAVGTQGGVAYFAHVGGFLFGLAAIKLFAREREREPPLPVY